MSQLDALQDLAKRSAGVLHTADLNALGINAYSIRKLIEGNRIERIRHGYYRLADGAADLSEAAQIAQLFPDGVLCMYTALFHHGYSDRVPIAWDIAVDKNTSKSRFKLDYPYVQPYYLKPEALSFGVETAQFDDCSMKVFDRDRLICECVFYENKMDTETYNKAIQGYVHDPGKSVSRLLEYANKRGILRKVKARIGVWL